MNRSPKKMRIEMACLRSFAGPPSFCAEVQCSWVGGREGGSEGWGEEKLGGVECMCTSVQSRLGRNLEPGPCG